MESKKEVKEEQDGQATKQLGYLLTTKEEQDQADSKSLESSQSASDSFFTESLADESVGFSQRDSQRQIDVNPITFGFKNRDLSRAGKQMSGEQLQVIKMHSNRDLNSNKFKNVKKFGSIQRNKEGDMNSDFDNLALGSVSTPNKNNIKDVEK